MLENKFKTWLCKEIESRFPGSMTVHLDPTEKQGIPDLLVLFPNGRWAALEGKKNASASHRPNQNYYVEKMNDMGFARFIFPENKDAILDEISREVAQ